MSLLIKVCGLREERDVAAAVAAGAGALGFVFAESPRRITPAVAKAISAGVPRGIKRVAVMLHPQNDDWLAVLEQFRPDVLQTDVEDFATLEVPAAVERWPVFREGQPQPDSDTTYVYEGRRSGRGETIDWTAAAGIARCGRMVLAGGLHAGNVAAAIRAVSPFGVDASSGLESAPGRKDPQLIEKFVSAAKAAEQKS